MSKFTIAGIIQSIDHQLFCYDTTYCTYKDALVHEDDTLVMIIALSYSNSSGGKSYKFIDGVAMLKDYITGGPRVAFDVSNWRELERFINALYNTDPTLFQKYLTYTAVPGLQYYVYNGTICSRTTPFTTNAVDALDIVSFGYSRQLEGSYTSVEAPHIRNLSHRRIHLPDLVFTKTNDNEMNFENTLVSVDGVFCYPVYSPSTDELYACNGARFLKNTTDSNSLNILLMDFSKLGTLTHYKLSECKQELIIKNGTEIYQYVNPGPATTLHIDPATEIWKDAQYTMKFALPEGATNGVPLLSLAGRLFIPGLDDLFTYEKDGRIWVEFHITSNILDNIIASNLQHQNLFFNKSDMFRIVLSYVFCNIFIDQAYRYDEGTSTWLAIQFYMDQVIPFISILSTDKPFMVNRTDPCTVFGKGKIIFPKDSRGLLMNNRTREFIDYTRVPYKDQLLVTYTVQNPLFVQIREGSGINNDKLVSKPITYDELMFEAPNNLDIEYVPSERRYKLFTYAVINELTGAKQATSLYGESQEEPVEREAVEGGTIAVGYTFDELGVDDLRDAYEDEYCNRIDYRDEYGNLIECFKIGYHNVSGRWIIWDNLTNLPYAESDVDDDPVDEETTQSYKNLTWYKVLPYSDEKIVWYRTADGTRVNTDSNSVDRMGWSSIPAVYSDAHNRFNVGEFVKDPHHYSLISVCMPGDNGDNNLLDYEDNPEAQADPGDDLSHPMVPVLTAEYERVKDKIKIAQGTAPVPLAQLKVTPAFIGGNVSTTSLDVNNATNINAELTIYDGRYEQVDPEIVGTDRVWQHTNNENITIRYGVYSEHNAWLVMNGDTIIFATDIAGDGSAPYNTILTWSHINAE